MNIHKLEVVVLKIASVFLLSKPYVGSFVMPTAPSIHRDGHELLWNVIDYITHYM